MNLGVTILLKDLAKEKKNQIAIIPLARAPCCDERTKHFLGRKHCYLLGREGKKPRKVSWKR